MHREVPYFIIGLLFFLTAALAIPVSIFGGNLIDRLGRRRVGLLIPPLAGTVFAILSAGAFFHWPLYIIAAAFIAIDPLVTVQIAVDSVLITDIVEESRRTDAFSLLRIAANLGFSIGPSIGGFLALINFGYVFLVPATIAIVEFTLFFLYIEEPEHESSASGSFSFPTGDRKFLITGILIALVWFIAGQWGTTLTLFWTNFDKLTSDVIGMLYGVNGLVVVLMQIPTNILMRRFRDSTKIAIGGLVFSLAFLGMAFSANLYYLLVLVFFMTIGENIVSPVMYTLIGKMAPESKRGQYFGAFSLMIGTALAISPLMGAYLLGIFATNGLYFWSIIGAMGCIISMTVFSYGRKSVPN